MTPRRNWHEWYRLYDDPGSSISQRLAVVRERIRIAVEAARPGPVRVLSLCAGDGRDLIGALAEHPRRDDVRAHLVELDPDLAERGRAAAWAGVSYVVGDASRPDTYAGAIPADLLLACGVFGNITDDDIATTVAALPSLLAPGGTVIWTRHRGAPDLVPTVDAWFAEAGFERVYLSGPQHPYGVGVHRLTAEPRPLDAGVRLFTFVR